MKYFIFILVTIIFTPAVAQAQKNDTKEIKPDLIPPITLAPYQIKVLDDLVNRKTQADNISKDLDEQIRKTVAVIVASSHNPDSVVIEDIKEGKLFLKRIEALKLTSTAPKKE